MKEDKEDIVNNQTYFPIVIKLIKTEEIKIIESAGQIPIGEPYIILGTCVK